MPVEVSLRVCFSVGADVDEKKAHELARIVVRRTERILWFVPHEGKQVTIWIEGEEDGSLEVES